MNTKEWFKQNQPNKCKEYIIVYQNLHNFLIPTLRYETIEFTNMTIVRGLKKKKYTSGTRNLEKIAVLVS